MKDLKEEIVSLKEGRVISGKNKKIIGDAIASMKLAISSLKNLLLASEPSIGSESKSFTNGRQEVAQKPRKNRVMVRTLQKISNDISNLLHDIKK